MGYVPEWSRQSFKKAGKEVKRFADGGESVIDKVMNPSGGFQEGVKEDLNAAKYWGEGPQDDYWRERAKAHNAEIDRKSAPAPTPKRVSLPVNRANADADDRDTGTAMRENAAKNDELQKDVAAMSDIGMKDVPRPAPKPARRTVTGVSEQAGPPKPVEQAGPPRPVEQAGPPRPSASDQPASNPPASRIQGPTYSGAYPASDAFRGAGAWLRRNLGTQAQRDAQRREDENKK